MARQTAQSAERRKRARLTEDARYVAESSECLQPAPMRLGAQCPTALQPQYGSSASPAGSEPIFETTRVETFTDKLDVAVSPELLAKMLGYWQKIELLPGA